MFFAFVVCIRLNTWKLCYNFIHNRSRENISEFLDKCFSHQDKPGKMCIEWVVMSLGSTCLLSLPYTLCAHDYC